MVIGDSSNDIELFRATGNGILVDTDGSADETLKTTAKYVVTDLADTHFILQALTK